MNRLLDTATGALIGVLLLAAPGVSQIQVRPARTPERVRPPLPNDDAPAPLPVAETKLIMEGLSQPNYQGIGRHLRKKPENIEAWTFLRGQALLVAEAGNLLMLRPPRGDGRQAWLQLAAGQRTAATQLAHAAAERDYVKSRAALADLTNACNRCHQTFRVAARLDPLP